MSSSFKEKKKMKKKKSDLRVTLDAKHENKKKHFQSLSDNLDNKVEQLEKSKKRYKELSLIERKYLSDDELEELLDLKESISIVEKEIKDVEKRSEEVNYLLETGQLLYQYYDNIDKIAKGDKPTKSLNKKKSGPKSVVDFFQKPSTENNTQDNDKDNIKSSEEYQSRNKILTKYLNIVDNVYVNEEDNKEREICEHCGSDKYIIHGDASLICKKCGEVEFILIDSDKPSYKDPPKEISYFAYKRINHFNEWLAQFQAKETTDIPDKVYDQILLEIKKERIENMADLKTTKLRNILKKLKLNKYYEHVPHIINRLNGVPAPVMTRETEEKLRSMFKEIQTPFMKYCPKERKNFLSYSYVLHKFVQLLNLDEFLICFPLLKSREKLHQQDLIWKNICYDLQWEFIKSL